MESYVVSVDNVSSATGNLQQIYPPWCTAGSSFADGAEIRQPTDGVLYEITVYPDDAQGGLLEIWDVRGEYSGTNDVNTSDEITNAYVVAKQARAVPQARLIWKQEFKADPGLTTKKFTQRVKIQHGLAARFFTDSITTDTKTVTLNITSEGLYRKTTV